ncbi:MAG: hypothetical protein C4295_01845 [Candidatus Fervidibacterota bacterium]
MQREVPMWMAVVVILVVVVVIIGIYVAIGRRHALPPTAPPAGFKPQPTGPYPRGKGMLGQPPAGQPAPQGQPLQPPAGGQ